MLQRTASTEVATGTLAPVQARQTSRLLHVVQRLPEGMSVASIHIWGQKIIRIAGVGPGARYYLEQDGDSQENAGWRIHLHFSLYFKGYKSVLAQRIVQLKIIDAAMTQVFEHDDVNRLTTYLAGHKSQEKARKVATDHMWRQANGLKEYYTRSDAKDLGLDYHGRYQGTPGIHAGVPWYHGAQI